MTAPMGGQAEYLTALHKRRGEAVLAILKRAADLGAPCPTNDHITAAVSLGEAANVTFALNGLRDMGFIAIASRGGYRRVTICETGQSTDWTARPKRYVKRSQPVFREGREMVGSFRGDLPADRYVDRNPCGFCGVRGDVGCRHSQRVAA